MKNTSSIVKLILPIVGVGVVFILFFNYGLDFFIPAISQNTEFTQTKNVMIFLLFLMLLLLSGTTYIIYTSYVREPMDNMISFLSLLKDERYETYDKKFNTSDIDEFIVQINKIINFLAQKDKDTQALIKQIKQKEIFTNDILDSQLNPIIVIKDQDIISANKAFYTNFTACKRENGEDINNYKIFIDKFVQEDGYIYNFDDKQWFEYILNNKDKYHQAKIIENDKEIIFQIDVTNIEDDQYIVTLTNITEYIIALKKAQTAEAVKSTFLATMSHEIRTPLNGILGFSRLLEKSKLPKKEQEYINIINSSANSLLGIINDILDISKMESGKLKLEIHQFDPFKELEPTVELFAAKADEKNIDLLFFLDPDIPKQLLGDSLKIKQVISNLLSNAIKFTPQNGEVYIRIELLEKKDDFVKIRFSVKDNGVGISKEHQKNIFQPFSQADSSITRRFGGTGLGLTICSKIIDEMNSKIYLTSDSNKGSEFFFTLELESKNDRSLYHHIDDNLHIAIYCEEEQCRSQLGVIRKYIEHYVTLNIIDQTQQLNQYNILIIEYSDFIKLDYEKINIPTLIIINNEFKDIDLKDNFRIIKAPINPSKLYDTIVEISNPHAKQQIVYDDSLLLYDATVLIAEDNLVNQQLMMAMLKQRGIKTVIASNGKEALEFILNGTTFDLIFMDINMPVMNGIESTQKIIEYEKVKNLVHIPIIALTANAISGDREKFLEQGMDGYIPKPFEEKMLDDILEKHISKKDNMTGNTVNKIKNINNRNSYDIQNSARSLGLPIDIFLNIFKTFLEYIDDDIKNLETAINESDFKNIIAVSHKIKGASANLKIEKISELMTLMEQKAKENIDDDFITKIQWLKDETITLKEVLEEYHS